MSLRRSSVLSTYLATIVAVVFLGSLAQAQTDGAIGLLFPVKQNSVCGGTCTPLSAPIMTVFDHEMQVAYECTTGEGGYGSVTAFTGETGTVKYSGFKNGAGKCKGLLFAYTNPDVSAFLKGYNYPELESSTTMATRPSITAFPLEHLCTPRLTGASRISPAQKASLMVPEGTCLTIIPSPTKPAGGCQTLVNKTGYTVGYMHWLRITIPRAGRSSAAPVPIPRALNAMLEAISFPVPDALNSTSGFPPHVPFRSDTPEIFLPVSGAGFRLTCISKSTRRSIPVRSRSIPTDGAARNRIPTPLSPA